jgi:hypothetical protein
MYFIFVQEREINIKLFSPSNMWCSAFLATTKEEQVKYLQWMRAFGKAGYKAKNCTYMVKMLKSSGGKNSSYEHYRRVVDQIDLFRAQLEAAKRPDDPPCVVALYMTDLASKRLLAPLLQHSKVAWDRLARGSNTTLDTHLRTQIQSYTQTLNEIRDPLARAKAAMEEAKRGKDAADQKRAEEATLKLAVDAWCDLEAVSCLFYCML